MTTINVNINPEKTILFVGAGVSMSLGLPSWEKLIDEIGRQLKFDERIFKLYGNPLSLAEYYLIQKGSIGPLRSWMDVEWHKDVKIEKSELHKAIVRAGFRKIYTTNFDRWLEKSCEQWDVKYRKVASVNDIPAVENDELEIVKFHGDFDDDKTLVLSETNYFERLEFQSPLDLMLRADALRYSILFVGYSMSDINIRYLFYRLSELWRMVPNKNTRSPSYIYMMKPNPVEEAVFSKWGISPIINQSNNPSDGLLEFIKSFEKK